MVMVMGIMMAVGMRVTVTGTPSSGLGLVRALALGALRLELLLRGKGWLEKDPTLGASSVCPAQMQTGFPEPLPGHLTDWIPPMGGKRLGQVCERP